MAAFNVRPDIDAAAAKLNNTFGAKREIKRLPEVLWEGELIDMLATGTYANGTGIVAMTNMRLLFLKHGVMSQTVEDFPYGKVSSAQWHGGIVMGTLTVYTSGNRADIKNMPKDQGKAIADKLRMRIAQGTQPGAAPVPASPAPGQGQDAASRLATLDQLRAAGAITDAEYRDRRKAITDSL
ncbi:PH domain-containing protein [Streptomyces sp. ISL-11]|uniref:PH domain-containing protein n=1 Tax=Streptomyces sp. ISL-11 TaxID=2819174 RepID=UPI001BE65763|nr:PH domain-containing protein [Streptomyces sp. ISL-11]MBT2383313.1 PH domain-containing protein [Streptomyces sp. ISL-11]